jgi:hypothetical protein
MFYQRVQRAKSNAPLQQQNHRLFPQPLNFKPLPAYTGSDAQTRVDRLLKSNWTKNDPVLSRWAQEEAAAKSSDTSQIASPVKNQAAKTQTEDISLPSQRQAVLSPDQQMRVDRLLKSDWTKNDPVLSRWAQEEAAAKSSETSKIAPSIQAKLTVSTPGDKYEQEADAMAAKVMAMPDRALEPQQIASKQSNSTTAALQRAVNEDKTVSPELENRIQNATGSSPLPSEVRSFMESRFGVDFSEIRVHTDSVAAQMCKEVGAKAFAVGNRIYYGAGYAPGNNELTAHELTHTIQQGAAKPKRISGQFKANVQPLLTEVTKQIGAKKLQPQLNTASQSSSQIQRNPIAAQLESLRQLKDILGRVLGNAGGVMGSIIKNPVGFANNLVSALRKGCGQFVTNIRTHLQNGLVSWLTGGSFGSIRQPISLSNPQGIFNLALQLLGVGGSYIRNRAVKKFGAGFVSRLEMSVSLFQQLKNNGLLGMFSQIGQQLGNLQTTVVEEIRKFLIQRVIQAGVKWILGLLVLPISGIVKAAQTVYQVLDFFINQAARVAALVQAVTRAVQTVASGRTEVAAKAVEEALARSIPVLMGFLASLAGVGGNLAGQVRSLLAKVKTRIDVVIDGLLERAKSLLLQQQGNGGASRRKQSQSPSSQTSIPNRQKSPSSRTVSVTGHQQRTQVHRPGAATQNNNNKSKPNRVNIEHDRKVKVGLTQIDNEQKKYLNNGSIWKKDAEKVAIKVKQDNPIFKSITVVDGGKTWNYRWVASSGEKTGNKKREEQDTEYLKQAKQRFEMNQFTLADLQNYLKIGNDETTRQLLKRWEKDGEVRKIGQARFTKYTFAKEDSPTNQETSDSNSVITSKSRYIDKDGLLLKQYRGGPKIRLCFYGHGNRYHAEVYNKAKELVDSPKYTDPKDPDKWICPKTNQSVLKSDLTIDHDPPTRSHWNTIGRDTNQPTRIDWYNFKNRLGEIKIMSIAGARKQGGESMGEPYRHQVGPNFRGPDEKT